MLDIAPSRRSSFEEAPFALPRAPLGAAPVPVLQMPSDGRRPDGIPDLDALCKGRQYLVIDEAPAVALWLVRLLRSAGARVLTLSSSLDVAGLPHIGTLDAIFVSLELREEDPFATLSLLDSLSYRGPVIALASARNGPALMDLLGCGFHGVLCKPLRTSELVDILGGLSSPV